MVQPGLFRLAAGRVPLIKFRKGGVPSAPSAASVPAPPSTASSTQGQGQQVAQQMNKSIEDWELPLRYRRQPMSQEEMDMVNGGGIA